MLTRYHRDTLSSCDMTLRHRRNSWRRVEFHERGTAISTRCFALGSVLLLYVSGVTETGAVLEDVLRHVQWLIDVIHLASRWCFVIWQYSVSCIHIKSHGFHYFSVSLFSIDAFSVTSFAWCACIKMFSTVADVSSSFMYFLPSHII